MKIKRMTAVVVMLMMIATWAAFAEDASDYFVPQYIGGEDIRSVRRGDTFVVSMKLSVLQNRNYLQPFFAADPEVYSGNEAVELVRDMLPEDEFEKFCDDYERKGEAEGTAYVLSFVGNQGGSFRESDLFMDTRLIGSRWITITRPIETIGDEWDTRTNINRVSLHAKNGKLEMETTGNDGFYLYLEPERMKDVKADIRVAQDNLSIEVFSLEKQLDAAAHVAVIREKNGAEKQLWDVYFRIGETLSNPLQGYADGKNGVFCCILTDEEAGLLKDGSKVALLRG